MVREYGPPTLFLTLSCAEYNSLEIATYLRKVNDVSDSYLIGKLCTEDPISVLRKISQKYHDFFRTVILNGKALGSVAHYFVPGQGSTTLPHPPVDRWCSCGQQRRRRCGTAVDPGEDHLPYPRRGQQPRTAPVGHKIPVPQVQQLLSSKEESRWHFHHTLSVWVSQTDTRECQSAVWMSARNSLTGKYTICHVHRRRSESTTTTHSSSCCGRPT